MARLPAVGGGLSSLRGKQPIGDLPPSVVTASRVLRPSGGDDTTQLQNAVNAGGVVFLAPGVYTQAGTLDLASAVGGSLVALGGTSRWRPNVAPPVIINYTGNSNAVQLSISGTTAYDNYTVKGVRWDGTGAGSASVGLLLQTSSTGSPFIEGLLFEDSGFTNFGLNQIVLTGQVFDIRFRRLTAHNCSHGTDNVIQVNAAGSFVPGQLLFDDAWLVQSQNAKWCFFADVNLTQTYRFIAGCATTGNAAGTINTSANGIHCLGKLQLLSTHVEACGIGVEWAGLSATIIGNEIVSNTTGVVLGSSTGTYDATGAVVMGVTGNNTTDILVRNNIAHHHTQVFLAASTVVSDLRAATDGVFEVSYGATSAGIDPTGRTRLATPAGVQQNNGLYGGTGVPSNANGVNGDFYFRWDGGAGTAIYQKRAGAWVATAA